LNPEATDEAAVCCNALDTSYGLDGDGLKPVAK
jgi:hypothetical protein